MSIRWSNEDPNPGAKEQEEQELYMKLAQKVAEKQQHEDPVFTYKNSSSSDAPSTDVFPSQFYPNQYPNTGSPILVSRLVTHTVKTSSTPILPRVG